MIYIRLLSIQGIDEGKDTLLFHFKGQDWYLVRSTTSLGGEALEGSLSSIILSGLRYPPSWELAVEDTTFFLRRNDEIAKSAQESLRALASSVRFYLDKQKTDGFFCAETPRGSGEFYWIVGYHSGPLYLEDGVVYRGSAEKFGLDEEELRSRFPDTPFHYIDPRGLKSDYVPPSLMKMD